MKKLYRYSVNYGRHGSIHGIFVADDSEVARAIGQDVYFGEILGKHSEVSANLAEDDFQVLTDDEDFITKFEDFNCAAGINPLDYVDWDAIDAEEAASREGIQS